MWTQSAQRDQLLLKEDHMDSFCQSSAWYVNWHFYPKIVPWIANRLILAYPLFRTVTMLADLKDDLAETSQ